MEIAAKKSHTKSSRNYKAIKGGDELKIDFNGAVCKVITLEKERVILKAINGGDILNRAFDVKLKKLQLNPLTEFDV